MKLSKDDTHYEYIAVYVDDLAICMQDPQAFCDTLKEKFKLKLKGVDPISYHLGLDKPEMKMEPLLQIQGNMLAKSLSPMKRCLEKNQRRLRKYVGKILESYEKMFAEKPKKTRTQLVAGDHPENDLSDFCDQDQIKEYQMIVEQLIWLSGLGRFDIAVHVMTMSRLRQQPRVGHLERLKRIIGYLADFPQGSLRFRTHEPDYSNLPHKEYGWQRTVY